jgi:dTDP-4-amino-4,6-dideoxygalactose transaminase
MSAPAIDERDVDAVLDCLRSGWLTMGPRIAALEEALRDATGAPHAITVASGFGALELALIVAGVDRDEAADIARHTLAGEAPRLPAGVVWHGAAWGAGLGDAELACFDLEPRSPIGVGEGGVVLCSDDDHAARLKLLRSHALTSGTWDRHRGHSAGYDVVDVGFNLRMDEPRAALALSRLGRLHANPGANPPADRKG